MRRKLVVGVVGSGRNIQPAVDNARKLGELIALEGWIVLSGGRNAGVMKAVNDGAKKVKDSLTIGILPNSSSDIASNVDITIITDINNARNNIIGLSSNVVIACGVDGSGTASEIALALKNGRAVILLAVEDSVFTFFQRLAKDRVYSVRTPEEAIRIILADELC